jgi:hypothetical protein
LTKQRLNITIISVGSPGLQLDDTITIAGTAYTAKAAEVIASRQFELFTGGTPSENIDDTARSLIRVINRNTTNTTVYAYYLTGFNDLPGKILIEERTIGGGTFVAISSRGAAFSPPLPGAGSSYISNNEDLPNNVYFSKPQQPEAVPLLQRTPVGSAQEEILRIIALRDSVFVLKTDGIFRITGDSPANFRADIFDNTTVLKAQESAVAFNNAVHCFSEQGEVAVSDAGVAIISRPIEQTLLQLSSEQFTNFDDVTFAVSYESDRKYMLWTVTETDDDTPTQAFIYNSLTKTQTRWPLEMTCGLVATFDNKLYLGSPSGYVYQERKNYTISDYAEEELAVTIASSTGTTIVVNSTTGVNVGDSIAQFSGSTPIRESVITEVTDATHLEVVDVLSWAAAAATVFTPIETVVQYTPIHGGNPAMIKLFQDLIMFFSNAAFDSIEAKFSSDMSFFDESFEVTPQTGGGWGFFPWGSGGWGLTNTFLQAVRTLIPSEKARCHWFNLTLTSNQALTSFALVGISAFFDEISQKVA